MILFVSAPTPPKMQGRDAMAWTIQCADALEKVTAFKTGNFLSDFLRSNSKD